MVLCRTVRRRELEAGNSIFGERLRSVYCYFLSTYTDCFSPITHWNEVTEPRRSVRIKSHIEESFLKKVECEATQSISMRPCISSLCGIWEVPQAAS